MKDLVICVLGGMGTYATINLFKQYAAETEVADRPRQPVNYAGRIAERTADNARKPSVLAHLHAKQVERNVEPQKSQKRKSHEMEL